MQFRKEAKGGGEGAGRGTGGRHPSSAQAGKGRTCIALSLGDSCYAAAGAASVLCGRAVKSYLN